MNTNPKMLLIDAVKKSEQVTLFSSSEEDLEKACITFLKSKGYRVTKPVEYRFKIKSLDDLIKHFYLLLDSKHPEYVNVYRNIKRDRSIAKRFVDSRIEATGYSKELALAECGEIIATVFEHEKEFKFKHDISFGIFGQVKLGWITELAIKIMNKRLTEETELRLADRIKKIEEEQEKEYVLGFNDDVDAILKRIEGGA